MHVEASGVHVCPHFGPQVMGQRARTLHVYAWRYEIIIIKAMAVAGELCVPHLIACLPQLTHPANTRHPHFRLGGHWDAGLRGDGWAGFRVLGCGDQRGWMGGF